MVGFIALPVQIRRDTREKFLKGPINRQERILLLEFVNDRLFQVGCSVADLGEAKNTAGPSESVRDMPNAVEIRRHARLVREHRLKIEEHFGILADALQEFGPNRIEGALRRASIVVHWRARR